MQHRTPRKSTATLATLRAHPAVSEIIIESDFGRRTYWINLRPGFATDGGRGQQSGSESTLRGVAAFLRGVAAVPAEAKPAAPVITAEAAPALRHSEAALAAAFRTAATAALSDMEAAAARDTAARAARLEALEAPRRAAYAAEAKREAARKRCEAAEAARVAAFNAWKQARDARFAVKPFPVTCPAEAAAWQTLQAAEAKWARVHGQFTRRFPTA